MEESGGQVRGRASLELDDCPFTQEVNDETGRVIRVEPADSAVVKACAPWDEKCRLDHWMQRIKVLIASINVDGLQRRREPDEDSEEEDQPDPGR